MSRWSQYLFFVILISIFPMFGCSGASVVPNPAPAPTPASFYQIVTVSDLHFNPLYDSNLFAQLTTNDPSQWAGIFGGSSVTTASAAGADTNYKLLTYTLKSMKQNMGSSPVVLFTGDLLGHNIPATYCKIYGSLNPSTAASCATSQVSAIQTFINNTFTFVAMQIRQYVGNAPVIYVPGNIDAYSGSVGPDSKFLNNNEPIVYSQFLNKAFDEQAFLNTFTLAVITPCSRWGRSCWSSD